MVSNQIGVDQRLPALIERYRQAAFRKPVAQHTREAFAWLADHADLSRPLVLDGGCGTAMSTRELARAHPDEVVLGVDQSAHRLARGGWQEPGLREGNQILLRAELSDLWRLMEEQGVRLARHYLLYPNPWPKPSQLQRRWHGHPAFASALALGGELELRTNWAAYAEEFAAAVGAYGWPEPRVERFAGGPPTSNFERKYLASSHALYRVRIAL
ncbi:MAG: SAM-dependent methyltransferase [Pseudomonadota bacterium]